MRAEVKIFVEICRVCQYAKGKTQNTGMYQPLPIPSRHWDSVSINFILGLTKTKRNHDTILVVVDTF